MANTATPFIPHPSLTVTLFNFTILHVILQPIHHPLLLVLFHYGGNYSTVVREGVITTN